jgi:hypothetical protein
MIKLEKTEVVGLEAAMRGMRNPKNSWLKSDSCYRYQELDDTWHYEIGEADHALAMTLATAVLCMVSTRE